MIIKHEPSLTIAVCSNRIEKLKTHTLPILKEMIETCSIQLFLDGALKEDLHSFYEEVNKIGNIEIISSNKINAHSNLRNLVLQSCKTKYVLFLDDDITITPKAIKEITEALENNFQVVGLKLVPADYIEIQRWYISKNQYHYLAIHTEFTLNNIWGACMAFCIEPIKRLNLIFDHRLGRQKNKFLSGEDTTFISHLIKCGCKAKLIQSSFATHHIDETRLNFSSLTKRVFWQGITEVVRRNIRAGFVKELRRNFAAVNLLSFFLGCLWMIIFSIGCIYGIFYSNFHHDSI
jgi:glycosyltransferase involved in cell wall biosynthesis